MGASGPDMLLMRPDGATAGGSAGGGGLVQGAVGVMLRGGSERGPPKEVQRARLKEWLLDVTGDVKLQVSPPLPQPSTSPLPP